jgi:hypothetical protein
VPSLWSLRRWSGPVRAATPRHRTTLPACRQDAGPNTNGSQFFLVFADSRLRPNYTIFGTADRLGLKALDRVAAAGVVPTDDDPAPVDGAPNRKTDIMIALSLGGSWPGEIFSAALCIAPRVVQVLLDSGRG